MAAQLAIEPDTACAKVVLETIALKIILEMVCEVTLSAIFNGHCTATQLQQW